MGIDWLNRLGKWRSVFAGRLLGTRLLTDPQSRGARDLADKLNALKAEGKTVTELVIENGIFTRADFERALGAQLQEQRNVVRDVFENVLRLRAEMNALSYLLLERGVVSPEAFTQRLLEECRWLCEQYEKEFPGFKASDVGMNIDTKLALQTTKGWPS